MRATGPWCNGSANDQSLGTLLVDHLGWESAFFINVPIGGYALHRAITTLEESGIPMPVRRSTSSVSRR